MKTAAAARRTSTRRLQVSENYDALCRLGAEHFVQIVLATLARRDRVVVALAGGSTPKGLYTLLATEPYRVRVPWEKIHVFWGDERCVPPDSLESNYRMAHEVLLAHVPVQPENITRLRGEGPDLEQAARDYESALRAHYDPGPPVFDLVHLGMGDDGHTASLFPHSPGLAEAHRLVIVNRVDKLGSDRLTFTYPLLNAAAHVVFLVSGAGKAQVLKQVLEGQYVPDEFPAQGVQPVSGTLTWLLDKAAAADLSAETLSRRPTN